MTTQTVNPIPEAGSAFLEALQTFLRSEDADRFVLMFQSFVAGGGLHGTVAGLTATPVGMGAFPGGFYATEGGSITYADDSTTWVIASPDTAGNLGGFTRVAGTHYLTSVVDLPLPTDCVRLMRVTTAAGSVTAVVDERQLSPLVNRTNNPYVRLLGTETLGVDMFIRENAGSLEISENTGDEDQPVLAVRFRFDPANFPLILASGVTTTRTQTYPDKDGTFAMLDDIGGSAFPPGTRLFFDNDTAPAGWTRDVTGTLDDRALRLVVGARADGGSWTLTGITMSSHTHTLGAHQHDAPVAGSDGATQGFIAKTSAWTPGASASVFTVVNNNAVGYQEAPVGVLLTGTPDPDLSGATSPPIASDGTWRPLYRDIIVAEKT